MVLSEVIANMRDPEGLVTSDGFELRPRRLLRSAALLDLDEHRFSALIGCLGPCHYFDLRTDWEVMRDGDMERFEDLGWSWHRLPIQEDDTEFDQCRRHIGAMPSYVHAARQIISTLANQDSDHYRSGIVSCSLGKDRTGVIMALILRWLGVGDEAIVADCVASNHCMRVQRHLLPLRWRHPAHAIHDVDAEACLDAIEGVSLEPLPPGARWYWLRSPGGRSADESLPEFPHL